MRNSIFKIIGIVLLLVMSMLCCSCTAIKCVTEKQSCKWDCPSTIGLSQACEQKCNILYDVCRNKE
jgi:hypothetical protein